jgi:hypothetical protein
MPGPHPKTPTRRGQAPRSPYQCAGPLPASRARRSSPRPLHHDGGALEANFGILVDWWDRLFSSYAPIERPRAMPAHGQRLKDYLAIPWR